MDDLKAGDSRGPDDERLALLIRAAGRRPAVPAACEARVKAAVRASWRGAVARKPFGARGLAGLAAGLAAAVALAVAGWAWWRPSIPVTEVARLEDSTGGVRIEGPSAPGGGLGAGQTVVTPVGARASLRLGKGPAVRLDERTRLRLDAAEAVSLESGAVYVNRESVAQSRVEVRTKLGSVREDGTQFEVRLSDGTLRVRVREGRVTLTRGGRTERAAAGEELTVSDQGPVIRGTVSATDPGWGWAGAIAPAVARAGVVSHIRVVSDKVPDLSTIEAWKRATIKDGMSDAEKGAAIWKSVYTWRHQDIPPNELRHEGCLHDPIRIFNVFGYGMCCCASANVEALSRYCGLEARGRIIFAHSVPEVQWDGKWHLVDSSLICFFPDAAGRWLGVDEMIAGVADWYGKNPAYRKNDAKLREFMRGGGWRKGPEVLSRCPTYDDNGWLPAATHGWYSTMQEYDCKPEQVYEYGYTLGYELNVELRQGERITRNWSNRGLHVNREGGGGAPGCLNGKVGAGDLRYSPKLGDIAPGRIGNGTQEYEVPLADGTFRLGAVSVENLACNAEDKAGPALHVKDPAQPGIYVVRMPTGYVYLGGQLTCTAVVGEGGAVKVSFSDNNGLDWKDVARFEKSGEQKVDLKSFVYRRYDYRLRFEFAGKGTGLEALRIAHDIQHSQRALPALGEGENRIAFSVGAPESTITVETTSSHTERKDPQQVLPQDFHVKLDGVETQYFKVGGTGKGEVTFPIATPGEMTRLRFGGHYRARDKADGWDLMVSFDDGRTFRKAGRLEGPTGGFCRYVSVTDVPAGTRSAQVRFSGQQRNTTCLFQVRIDADYKQPSGGFAPVKVTYVWEEGGQERKDVHVAKSAEEAYAIRCAAKPLMKSIVLERAD
jgi:predicted transcriptional regulator